MQHAFSAFRTVLTALALLVAGGLAVADVVFEDNFDGLRDGERPSSIFEVRKTPWLRGEAVGKRYAINTGGNVHRLVMPKVRDFELSFTAEPHERAKYAPIMIVSFRSGPSRGYRLQHWFGPTFGRVDLHHRNDTIAPPIRNRLNSTRAPKISLPQARPIRWRLSVNDATFSLRRNGKEIWTYTDTDRPTLEAGAVAFEISLGTKNPTAPLYLDNIRVESDDAGIADKFRRLYSRNFLVPGHFVAAHTRIQHRVLIHEALDTGLDQFWTDLPNGRVYRLTSSVNFPDMSEGKGRKMAAQAPYVRLETPAGKPIIEQRIYDGILGSTWPGHHSGPAQILRLRTEHDDLPPDGVAIRNAAGADATGPQEAVAYLLRLPADFNVTAGWEYWLDNDHIHVAGPVEATWNREGKELYAGRPIHTGELTFELASAPSLGILERIGQSNRYYKDCVHFQERNHYFLEGEPVTFTVDCGAGMEARLDPQAQWQLLDCYLRSMAEKGTVQVAAPNSSLWPHADRKATWQTKSFEPQVSEPGVYWLQLTVGGETKHYAFSIVPRRHHPGVTSAAASGLPHMFGDFFPMQRWPKDIHHYLSCAGGSRNDDWHDVVHAYNMLGIARGRQPPEALRKVEGVWDPGLKGVKLPPFPKFPKRRLWREDAANADSVKAFLASSHYRKHAEDAVLRDPEAAQEHKWQVLTRHHLKEWADCWSALWAERDVALRKAMGAVKPGLVTSSYGPPLISSFQYGNIYCGKYYGWDWKRRVGRPHLVTVWKVETYAREFARPSMSYTPSLALTKMSLPEINCQWELYGSLGGVEDSRMAFGRPPHGLCVPNRDAVANHATELSLAPWFFDGDFKPGSGTHLTPWVGHFTQNQVFGLIDGMRMFHEAQGARPVRAPAFVRSYAAAELDPSWHEQSINNSAAEAPAYAYVQARMAGLAGGFFADIADVANLKPADTDLLVLPSMRGATTQQIAAIREKYSQGCALLCFDDCSGLEDLFGVQRLAEATPIAGVSVGAAASVLDDVPPFALRERVRHKDAIAYELAGAREVLIGTDSEGRRAAPLLTVRQPKGQPGAVFYTLGATRVGRRRKRLDDTNNEGEVTSDLVRHALRAAMRAVARPVVTVTGPASVLAFARPDGSLYIVVLEASFPEPRPGGTSAEVLLSVHCDAPPKVTFACDKPLLEMQPEPSKRTVKMSLRPDQVVSMAITF
ncbi:MAG: hypothetical protein HN742_22865 [Lentisphaerae bacterium]|mgnify:CR=1 FL=1|jgi:hypothetical protein|nr:hypothetical protein [Lentisphaerota bacterium]MBT5606202.1 hypothetical protein [Lentisphaerota bacterium]MBT7060408.1 hypothetical protein [Lentisphaerota bacterium]MBT7844738.1 hypothetical protein [Lentisphaerota bacterium]